MAEVKPLRGVMDIQKHFVSEGGECYRRYRQDETAIKNHVRFLRDKVNDAPRSGNRNDWRYVGSMTWGHVMTFLEEQGKRDGVYYDASHFAANVNGIKDEFKKRWFASRELSQLRADHKTAQVTVPKSILRQAADVAIGGN